MRRISPRRRLPQLLRLLLFIGVSSATTSPDAAANYTLGESYRAQSLSTSISSPWPPPTRVRNIKGAVPAKTKSTGDVTSRLLVADGDTDATADGLEEIGKKSGGGGGDFRDSRDFKADDAFPARDHSADFKAGGESDFSKSSSFEFSSTEKTRTKARRPNGTLALFEANGSRKKRDNWYFAAVPNFWTYQPQGYLYYGFGIPVVLIQWPGALPMRSPHRVHSPNQNHNANDHGMIKSGVDFNDLNYAGDDENFKGKGKFDYEDEDDGHDEYDEHIHIDDKEYEEEDVVKHEEPEKLRTGQYSGGGKWRPIFPSKKPESDVKKPLPTPKKRRPLEHWLQHVFPPWPKNRTVIGRN